MEFKIVKLNKTEKDKLNEILVQFAFLRYMYPDFVYWYRNKVVANIKNESRNVYIAVPEDNESIIAGVLILKNDSEQKKICTLCVREEYQRKSIGTQFIKLAIKELKTDKPLLTVSAEYLKQYESLFDRFCFNLHGQYKNYYRDGYTEYSYNKPIEETDYMRLLKNA